MEHLMDQYLNEPPEIWTPWDADEDLLWLILSDELTPPTAPEHAFPKAA